MSDDTDYALYDFDEPKKADAAKPAPVVSACPKCGKELGRGGHFHVKHCRAGDDRAPR